MQNNLCIARKHTQAKKSTQSGALRNSAGKIVGGSFGACLRIGQRVRSGQRGELSPMEKLSGKSLWRFRWRCSCHCLLLLVLLLWMIERTLPPFFVVRRQGYIWGYCLLDLWLTPLVALWHLLIVSHKLKWFKIDYKVCVCADSFEMCVSIVLFMCVVYTIQYTQHMHCIYI